MSKEKYTQGEYLKYNPTWHTEDSPWKAQQIMKIIKRNDLNPKTICEVGCGAGEILNQLYFKMNNNTSFVGYEISPQAYEFCKQKTKDRLRFYCSNLMDNKKAFFDLVLIIDVIEHVEDYMGFLKNLHKYGSYQVFHIPLDFSVQSVLLSSHTSNWRKHSGHIHYFTKQTVLASLIDTGYKIIDYFYTAVSIDLPAKLLKTSLARVPRRILYKFNKDLTVRLLGGYSLMVLTK